MNVVHVDEYLDENAGEIVLIPTGDWHLGATDAAEEKLREDVKAWAEIPNARLLLMGDLMELIDYRDKRFFPQGLPQRYADALLNSDGGIPSESVQHALEVLDPWIGSGRIWGIVTGNHERKLEVTQSRNLTAEVAKEANISHRQLGYGGYVHVSFRVRGQKKSTIGSLVIHAHHGWQTAGRAGSGNLLNGMERELGYSNADIILRGHSHAPRVAQVVPSLRVERSNIVEWPRVVASTGTYKRGSVVKQAGSPAIDTYESFKGFRGRLDGSLGPPIITIRARNRSGSSTRARFDYEVTV
jgi:UDP-2,3-diacylglucosamine pyrophosphatase LpxH